MTGLRKWVNARADHGVSSHRPLARSVKIRILSHLALRLLAFLFVVHEHPAVAKVLSLRGQLGLTEKPVVGIKGTAGFLSQSLEVLCFLRAQAQEQFVIQGQINLERPWVALTSTAAGQLAVDARRHRASP